MRILYLLAFLCFFSVTAQQTVLATLSQKEEGKVTISYPEEPNISDITPRPERNTLIYDCVPETIHIPVFFHVIYNDNFHCGSYEDLCIDNEGLEAYLPILNNKLQTQYMKQVAYDYIVDNHGIDVVQFDTQFRLYISDYSPEGNYAPNDPQRFFTYKIVDGNGPINADEALEILPPKGGDNYLNIYWVPYLHGVESNDIHGIASGPNDNSNVIMLSVDPDPYLNEDDEMIFKPWGLERTTFEHEFGHWLGLFHTWGTENEDVCWDSDDVDDTNHQEGPHLDWDPFNFEPQNTCDGSADMHFNHMTYSNGIFRCYYTKGQVARMRWYLENHSRRKLAAHDKWLKNAPVAFENAPRNENKPQFFITHLTVSSPPSDIISLHFPQIENDEEFDIDKDNDGYPDYVSMADKMQAKGLYGYDDFRTQDIHLYNDLNYHFNVGVAVQPPAGFELDAHTPYHFKLAAFLDLDADGKFDGIKEQIFLSDIKVSKGGNTAPTNITFNLSDIPQSAWPDFSDAPYDEGGQFHFLISRLRLVVVADDIDLGYAPPHYAGYARNGEVEDYCVKIIQEDYYNDDGPNPLVGDPTIEDTKEVLFYPNPASESVSIKNALDYKRVIFYDIGGNLILNHSLEQNRMDEAAIDISSFPKDQYYILNLITIGGTVNSGKLFVK